MGTSVPLQPRFIYPGVVSAVCRRPEYRDVFPIGASLADAVVSAA